MLKIVIAIHGKLTIDVLRDIITNYEYKIELELFPQINFVEIRAEKPIAFFHLGEDVANYLLLNK